MNNRNLVHAPLTGKVAIVTGGSGFLGQQHCLALLEQGATVFNFDIAPLDLGANSEFKLFESSFHNVICDLTAEMSVKNAVDEVLKFRQIYLIIRLTTDSNTLIYHPGPTSLLLASMGQFFVPNM
jgi:NAD(P)-dependent dehydrogenase (short-subunit alcohol dehydrogenase family)